MNLVILILIVEYCSAVLTPLTQPHSNYKTAGCKKKTSHLHITWPSKPLYKGVYTVQYSIEQYSTVW